jgi:WD40 repeat protein
MSGAFRSLVEATGSRGHAAHEDRYRYDVFIAYSRKDEALASAVQRGLERLAKPWNRIRALDVFRDDTSLAAGTQLKPQIAAALEASRHLLLLASPEAATSPWVCDEVELWLRRPDGEQTLMIAAARGRLEWDGAAEDYSEESYRILPECLKERNTASQLFRNMSSLERSELTLESAAFSDDIRAFSAKVRGEEPRELESEERRERRRTERLVRSAIAALLTLTALAIVAGLTARSQRATAVREASVALSRQLSAQAQLVRTSQPDLSLLLGVQALNVSDSAEGRADLLGTLLSSPQVERFLYGPNSELDALSFLAGGNEQLVGVHENGEVTLWNANSGTGRVIADVGEAPSALTENGVVAIERANRRLEAYRLPLPGSGLSRPQRILVGRLLGCKSLLPECQGTLVAMSPDGRWVVTSEGGRHLRVWDTASGRSAAHQPPAWLMTPANVNEANELVATAPPAEFRGAAQRAAHLTALRSGRNPHVPPGTLDLWAPLTGHLKTLVGLPGNVQGGPFAIPIAVGVGVEYVDDAEGVVEVEAAIDGPPHAYTRKVARGPTEDVGLAALGSEVAALEANGNIRLTGQLNQEETQLTELGTPADDLGDPQALAVSRHGGRLAVTRADGRVAVVATEYSHRAGIPVGAPSMQDAEVLGPPQPSPEAPLVFSDDGNVVAASTAQGGGLWRVADGRLLASFELNDGFSSVRQLAVAPDDHTIAFETTEPVESPATGTAPPVKVWNGRTGGRIRTAPTSLSEKDFATAIAFSPRDSNLLVVGTSLGELRVLDLSHGKTLYRVRLAGRQDAITALGTPRTGSSVVVAVRGSTPLLLDPATGILTRLAGPRHSSSPLQMLALSSDGQLAAGTAGSEGLVIWDPFTGIVLGRSPAGQISRIAQLVLGDDLVATLGADETTGLYEVQPLREVGRLPSAITDVSFSPSGGRMALGTVIVPLEARGLAALACRVANRSITRAEWDLYLRKNRPYERTCPPG